jgi:hypothetical protein
MFAAKAALGRLVAAPEYFAGYDVTIARPVRSCQHFAHNYLGFATGVGFGVVEKINTGIVSGRHTGFGLINHHLVAKCDPGTKR